MCKILKRPYNHADHSEINSTTARKGMWRRPESSMSLSVLLLGFFSEKNVSGPSQHNVSIWNQTSEITGPNPNHVYRSGQGKGKRFSMF